MREKLMRLGKIIKEKKFDEKAMVMLFFLGCSGGVFHAVVYEYNDVLAFHEILFQFMSFAFLGILSGMIALKYEQKGQKVLLTRENDGTIILAKQKVYLTAVVSMISFLLINTCISLPERILLMMLAAGIHCLGVSACLYELKNINVKKISGYGFILIFCSFIYFSITTSQYIKNAIWLFLFIYILLTMILLNRFSIHKQLISRYDVNIINQTRINKFNGILTFGFFLFIISVSLISFFLLRDRLVSDGLRPFRNLLRSINKFLVDLDVPSPSIEAGEKFSSFSGYMDKPSQIIHKAPNHFIK